MRSALGASVADLGQKLFDRGIINSLPELSSEIRYRGVSWSLEPTAPGDLHINLLGERRAIGAIRSAVDAGAVAVCWSNPSPDLAADLAARGVAVLKTNDERRAMSFASANLFGFPSHGLPVVGVTGTNAKTTVVLMAAACLQRAGVRNAFSCSELAGVGDRTWRPTLTTPDAPQLQRWLGESRDADCEVAVVEVSSQAIADARVADVEVDIGVCTTIGVDHLDVHGDEATYRATKRSMFEQLGPAGYAVFHGDEPAVVQVAAGTGAIDVSVGRSAGSAVRITDDGLFFGADFARLSSGVEGVVEVSNPHVTGHVLTSAALAGTAAVLSGASFEAVEAGLNDFAGLPRRLQVVTRRPFTLVDDMCNPHSLANTVEAALTPLRREARRFVAAIAVRGNRGAELNAQQGELLGGILVGLDVDEVHVTRSEDFMGDADRVTEAEQRALIEALDSWGLEVRVHAGLRPMIEEIAHAAARHDLVFLVGHPGLAPGVDVLKELLRADGRRGRRSLVHFAPPNDELLARSAGRSSSPTAPADTVEVCR